MRAISPCDCKYVRVPKAVFIAALCLYTLQGFGQGMHVKTFNFTSFSNDYKKVTEVLEKNSSDTAKRHPEYGIAPYNTQCTHCVELIDKRTVDTRFYLDEQEPFRSYSQKSYFPLHYKKSADDVWRTIDPRLHPDLAHPGVYIADRQPRPLQYNSNNKTCTLKGGKYQFDFNHNLKRYFFDSDIAASASEKGNYDAMTAGDEGIRVKNMWKDIDMQHVFSTGKIETNFVINKPLDIPVKHGYMVIEDRFSLPEGTYMSESHQGHHLDNGYYQGDYIIKNASGDSLLVYGMPVYVDAKAYGMHGMYKLQKNESDYTLQMLIPISWLSRTDHTYPLFIDPPIINVMNDSTIGSFQHVTGSGTPAGLGFTSFQLGSCDYHINNMIVPGESQLQDAYVDLEYDLTYSDSCGPNPYEAAPYCTFSQVTEEVDCDTCKIALDSLRCNPALPPYTGTCTTDSALVPAAGPLNINMFAPAFLSCLNPQCPDYSISFTLKDRDSICGDVCGYLCATGNIWRMTIEACRVHGDISADPPQICAGQPVTFTVSPLCGVPPYHFMWLTTTATPNVFDTTVIYGITDFVIHPEQNVNVLCYIYDTCGNNWESSLVSIAVTPSPPADAGDDTAFCGVGTTVLGGNPTTNGASVVWKGLAPAQTGWLSSTTATNPTLTIPPGNFGDFTYVVIATNPQCFRTDTVRVVADAPPHPTVDTTGPLVFCSDVGVQLSVQQQYAIYQWSNGGNTQSITVYDTGSFSVIVTDTVGCTGTSGSTIISTVLPAPPAVAGPDTFLCNGGTVVLGGNPTTSNATIQWTGDDAEHTGWLSSISAGNPKVTVPHDTLGTFVYILTTMNNQCSRMDTVIIYSYSAPVPSVDTSGNTIFCTGQSVQLSVMGTYASYLWSNGATGPTITVTQTGTYSVTVTDSTGCTASGGITQVQNNSPQAFSVYPDTTIVFGDSVLLTTDINLSAVSIDSFTWYPQVNITCLTCDSPVVAPKANQYYGLTIFANGCATSDSVLIAVILPDNFFIPNVFSPNGDGNDDYFYVFSQAGVTVYSFQVYDRWGEKVHDGPYPWDGSYRGKPAPVGVYTYVFKLGLFGDPNFVYRKGTVALLK